MVDREKMRAQLILHEGLKLRAYRDQFDNYTIGVGYNVTGRGLDFLEKTIGRQVAWHDGSLVTDVITRDEALKVLDADVDRVEAAIRSHFPDYDKLDEVRQRVCVDMTFNLGFAAFQWKHTIDAIKARDWSAAAKELYRSKWARQVDDGEGGHFGRADRLAQMLLTGKDYTH